MSIHKVCEEKESYLKDDATGQGSRGRRMQWALTSIVGLRCNGNMAIVIALFLCAHGQRSGVWYAFLGLLDVVLDSNDDRGPTGALGLQGCSFPISAL